MNKALPKEDYFFGNAFNVYVQYELFTIPDSD